ncbi:MAG: zf-HC2 domain-containing protein [Candidatus Binatia bacterium]|nr:zf-HC2 domain-containing protein [Candidatus Binatia bacterium]
MNCRETERLLDTFFDGELDGRLMRDAALHITRCPSCEQGLQAKEAVRSALAATIQHEVESADLSPIWAGVEGAIQGEQSEVSADEPAAPEESASRRLFGGRAGGRHANSSSRSARTGSRLRASAAAGMGAVAVGLVAFLLFPAEKAQLSDEKYSDAASQEGTTDGAETRVASPAKRGPTAQQVAAAKVSNRSGVETIALAPEANEEQLSSEWTQQLQVGPAEFNDHAMSLWRDTAAR